MGDVGAPESVAILGVSADYHDAAAALVVDGVVVAAAEEERFTRVKHDASLPANAIEWCLSDAGIAADGLAGLAFYDKPLTTYERILATHASVGFRGFPALSKAVSTWSRSKLWVAARLEGVMEGMGRDMPPLTFVEHHQSHAASAYYPSPFDAAAVLTFDGVGEWATTSVAHGAGKTLRLISELRFPDSLGLLYSAFTSFCGFEVNDGEYKLMGLAPYGEPRFADALRSELVDIAEDGSFRIDQRWFDYRAGRRMTRNSLSSLLDGPPRRPGDPILQRDADIAASIQALIEEIILRIALHAHDVTGAREVCLAGGVALNCVANARLLADGPFDRVWVQPAAGDAGGAIGAALWEWHQRRNEPRDVQGVDGMSGAFLGPRFDNEEVAEWLRDEAVEFDEYADIEEIAAIVAVELAAGATVGWFQGRMEFGPRALGHRSILADPRNPQMATRINMAVKGREGFRPFAPAVLREHASEWFDVDGPSPYMLFTAPVATAKRIACSEPESDGGFAARLAQVRSEIPACTHVDHSSRVQTVDDTNPEFRALLEAFHRLTDCPVLLNTSFNRAGEPIVRSPADALRCFEEADLDVLVIERCLIRSGPTC